MKYYSSLSHDLTQAAVHLFEDIIDPSLLVKRVTISAEQVISESEAEELQSHAQQSLFDFFDDGDTNNPNNESAQKDKQLQSALLDVREKFGKNAVVHAVSLKEEGTARERNAQIGGHSA